MHVAVYMHTQACLCESEDTLKTLALSSTVQVPGTGLGSSGSVAGVFAHSTISLAPKEYEVSLNRFFFWNAKHTFSHRATSTGALDHW